MKISVVIPTYEYYGRGVEFLDDIFRTISSQTLKDVEVVVSDHSIDDKIKEYCNFNEYSLNIKYIKNETDRGNPCSNINYAIDNASGEVIKVLLQDDFLFDTKALEIIYNSMKENLEKWIVCGCTHTRDDGHTFFNPIYPRWSDKMILENNNNFIGSPSVVAFKKEVTLRFDSNVAMLMDVDFYYNMKLNYGDPIYINDILIGNRVRDTQTWKDRISEEEINCEFVYVHQKYNIIK
jgi:glycosyltransferase involved in cell wall biosynthesis